MSGFRTALQVEAVDSKTWKLLSDLEWVGKYDDVFVVEAGSLTDFATVPWWTQSLIPRTGAWTKAAVVHDKMCDQINEHYRIIQEWGKDPSSVPFPWTPPVFDSVDADGVFRKNARELGTDRIRSELLWVGVRCGALVNPARRVGWMRTFPRFLGDLVAITAVLTALVFLLRFLF